MSSPISFLIENENTILSAYTENNGKPKDTWRGLEKQLPQLSQTMSFNTFKQYVTVFAYAKERLDKVRQNTVTQELSSLRSEKQALDQKLENAVRRLDKIRQNSAEIQEELEACRKGKIRLETELIKQRIELDKVRQIQEKQPLVTQKLDNKPKRICGWSVQHSKDGYYRCYRKIGKQLYSIYLGKELDVKEAESRIREKEKSLLLPIGVDKRKCG